MAETVENTMTEAPSDTDLVAAIQRVLEASTEPLTVSKIRAQLSARFRTGNLEEALHRQVASGVLYQFPKYRSQQDRYWDRPMEVHVVALLEETLRERPLAFAELRRKLPSYAQGQAEAALQEQVARGRLYRHPRIGRGGERFGVQPADPRDYLRAELVEAFGRLEQLGFTPEQLRVGALELLHEEEWASPRQPEVGQEAPAQPPSAPEPPQAEAAPSQPMSQQP